MCKVQLKNARLRPFALFMALFLMNVSWAFAQLTVTGNVQSTTGEPLIGVNVVEKGTTNGTVTDLDGNYTLRVAKGKTLVFSYIGFLSQEIVVNNAKVNVTLKEDTETLEEVVVIGYGSMARKDVTSSITTVKADQLNVGVFSDAASMLQGKVAGLNITTSGDPNGTPSITLRGASSLRTGQAMQPYYVIDGIPGVDISMVAPDDIESIDVLRDATATAIYGSKAANGVIIINTKKGKKGMERTNVTYSGYVAFDKILNTLDMATADDLRNYYEQRGEEPKNDLGYNTNWQDEVLRTAISHNHNLAINGGGERTTYMASLNYQQREGVIMGSSMDRLNVRSLVTTKVLKDHLEISAGVNARYGKGVGVPMGNEGASVLDAMNYFSPGLPVRNEDGSWSSAITGSKSYNPMSLIYEDTSETIYKNTQLLGKASLEILEGFKWNVNYSFTNSQSTYSSYDSHKSQIEGLAANNGQAKRNTYFGHEHIFETYGNYDTTFNDIHKLSLMAGYSWEEKMSNDGFGLTVHDFYDDVLKWNQLTYASTIDGMPAVESGTKEIIRNISFYGRASYSFNSRYMLQATVRRDGSSVFGKNKWGTFPSVSLAWNITEEEFMKNQNLFDNLKFRIGYGVSGNALGFGAYTAVETYGASGFFTYNGKQWRTLAATKNANPDLKWETTGMFNVGLDYGLFNGRLSGTIEFYNKKTKDLIWNYPVSTNIYPFGDIAANVGEITNRGVEISINAIPVQTKDFTWNTTLTLSHNKNTVDRLSNDKFKVGVFTQGDPMVAGVSSEGYTQRIIEGQPLGTFFTYEFAGFNDAGNATYYERDEETGERTGNTIENPGYKDRTITGCAQPKLNFGWNNTFNYKNWNATVFFTGVIGNDIYNGTRANYMSPEMLSGGKNVLKEYFDNPTTSGSLPSDRFIENGSYLRLSTLSIGYTFKNFNGWLQNAQLYVTCNNLFTITGYKGLDPEVNMGGIDPGVDYRWSVYPHTRTTMVGLKINF